MKIAVTSQDLRTVTPHAGHTRNFRIFEADPASDPIEVDRVELPPDLTFAQFGGDGPHPLDAVDVLIAGSFGQGFGARMAARGVLAVATTHTDPVEAILAFFAAGGPAAFATRGATA